MLEMNEEIRAQWTAALRSGKYPQTRTHLRSPEGYCCLGVLCELAVEAGVVQEVEEENGYFGYDGGWNMLPESVMNWAGLTQALPLVHTEGDTISLSAQNDGGKLFVEIADLIDGGLTDQEA